MFRRLIRVTSSYVLGTCDCTNSIQIPLFLTILSFLRFPSFTFRKFPLRSISIALFCDAVIFNTSPLIAVLEKRRPTTLHYCLAAHLRCEWAQPCIQSSTLSSVCTWHFFFLHSSTHSSKTLIYASASSPSNFTKLPTITSSYLHTKLVITLLK